MHSHSLAPWQHRHVYLGEKHRRHERRTWLVVALTAAMMVAEIVGGHIYGSMALVADGWHMSTHAGALAIAAFAYRFARRHAHDPRFSFGTGKIGELGGLFERGHSRRRSRSSSPTSRPTGCCRRSRSGSTRRSSIAVVGLAVNLVTAWMLYDEEHHRPHHARS